MQLRRDSWIAAQCEHHRAAIHRPQNASGGQLRDAVLPVLVLAHANINSETGLRALVLKTNAVEENRSGAKSCAYIQTITPNMRG